MLLIALAALMLQPWPNLSPSQIEQCGHAFWLMHTAVSALSLVAHYAYFAVEDHHYMQPIAINLIVMVLLRQTWRVIFLSSRHAVLVSACLVLLSTFQALFMWFGSDYEWLASLLMVPVIGWDIYLCNVTAGGAETRGGETHPPPGADIESQMGKAPKKPGSIGLKSVRISGALKKSLDVK